MKEVEDFFDKIYPRIKETIDYNQKFKGVKYHCCNGGDLLSIPFTYWAFIYQGVKLYKFKYNCPTCKHEIISGIREDRLV